MTRTDDLSPQCRCLGLPGTKGSVQLEGTGTLRPSAACAGEGEAIQAWLWPRLCCQSRPHWLRCPTKGWIADALCEKSFKCGESQPADGAP